MIHSPAHQPGCDPAFRSDATSGAIEVPSANLRIPGSQTTEERLRVECIDSCDIATKGECREVRPCQPSPRCQLCQDRDAPLSLVVGNQRHCLAALLAALERNRT